jgi:hypothetical protein
MTLLQQELDHGISDAGPSRSPEESGRNAPRSRQQDPGPDETLSPRLAARCGRERHELRDRSASLGDENLLAALHMSEIPAQLGLQPSDSDSLHVTILV